MLTAFVIRPMRMKAVRTSEMSVNFYEITQRNIQKTVIFILAPVGT
jgi:hypothetical protein